MSAPVRHVFHEKKPDLMHIIFSERTCLPVNEGYVHNRSVMILATFSDRKSFLV